MDSIFKLIFCFIVIVITTGAPTDSVSDSNQDPVTEIYEFWKKQEKSFHLDKRKNVILLLGNTGSGKSATALFVTGANLNASTITHKHPEESTVVSGDSDETSEYDDTDDDDIAVEIKPSTDTVVPENIFITDAHNKIGNETINSHTLIPDLFIGDSGVVYYDCPGFEDTREPKYELTIAFFLQKLMTYADSFKLVFVISHSSVKIGEDRKDFTSLARNAVKLIKNIGNYSEGIGLVVTKVQSPNSDTDVIESVAEFLKEVRDSIVNNNNKLKPSDDDERKLNDDSIKFIDALLFSKKSKKTKKPVYPRIGVFRRPQTLEPLDKIPIFQKEQSHLKKMINDRLQYVRKENDDFGFVISSESREYIVNLTKKIIDDGFVSDMASIRREVKEFYVKLENFTSDISELYEKSHLGVKLFSAISTEDPRQFMKEILNATYALDMDVSNHTIYPILRHIESIDFLMTVVDQKLSNQLIHEVIDIVEHLKNSQNWYEFLMYLDDDLTNIAFQNKEMKTVAEDILKKLTTIGEYTTSIKIDDIGLNPLLDKSANKKIPYINEISNVETSNLKALKNILTVFSSDKLNTTCSENELREFSMEVRGHVIKMSDIVNDGCYAKTKNINIFALNKLIVDENINKTGQQAQVVIIAPTWEIIEQKSFILDGKNAENHEKEYADNGKGEKDHSDNGKSGEPGSPGSAGGNLFAIGSRFLHGDSLTIQVNGGNGGAGQHGGNGTLRIEGRTPPVPRSECPYELESLWNKEKFTWDRLSVTFNRVEFEYMVRGWNGTKAGDGGDGGKKGDPGLAGKIVLFELDQAANINNQMINGVAGAIGKGGLGGGGETQNGKSYRVSSSDPNAAMTKPSMIKYDRLPCVSIILETFDYGKNNAGEDGKNDENASGWTKAVLPREFDHPLFAVNEYKSFAREYSIGSSRQIEINNFLNQITNNKTLKATYGPLDLINEFITMENQYFEMRGKIDFVPLLESLLKRTEEFSLNNEVSADQKRALAYLYTAILSKINGINNKVYKNTVFDLDGFLNQVNENIHEFHDSIKQNNMIMVRNDFNASLSEKIRSAKDFIETQITPVIDDVFDDVDEQIEKLIEESIGRQSGVIGQIAGQREARKQLEANIRLRHILAPMKIIATTATVFGGPVGAAVGTTINSGTSVIEKFALNNQNGNGNGYSTVSSAFKSGMTFVGELLKKRPEFIQQKIKDIDEYVKKNLADDEAAATATATTPATPTKVSSGEIQKLKDQIKTSKAEIDDLNKELTERIKKGDFNIPRDLMQRCDEIEKKLGDATKEAKEKLEDKKKQLTKDKEQQQKKLESYLKIISHVQNVVKIVDVSVETYKQITDDEDKLEAFGGIIAGLESDLEVLKDHERKIHSVLIPQIGAIHNNLNEMIEKLDGNAHVELDIKKWKIRGTFSEVRKLFNKMTNEFSVHDSLGLSIDKLDEGMATLINVYDRIDSYSETAKLAAYIENIASSGSPETSIGDRKLSEAVSKLRQMIQSNIVLEEYELAVHAFKQHYFPIADSFMNEFKLPESLQMNDTNSIIQMSIGQIKKLRSKIALSNSLETEYDNSLHTKAQFNGTSRSQSPFYVWKYQEYKDQINDLLRGKEITIKADVTRGVKQNAIKFNKIGIRFKTLDGNSQSDLDTVLYHNFKVSLSMVGTNYYRCNNRYYQIALDHNINMKLWFEKDLENPPNDPDETYRKIESSAAFLSPYAMWTIKLIQGDINQLGKYVDQALDMELIGTGQYLEHGEFSNRVCNDRLDKYYYFDETISNANTLMQSNRL